MSDFAREITDAEFDDVVINGSHSQLVVVDFWAPWCGPCRGMAPAFAQVAAELRGRAQLLKVNTEVEQHLASQFAIRSIPTLVLFRGGKEIERLSGALSAPDLRAWIERRL